MNAVRPNLLVTGFIVYAVLSLISMATMSIGAGFLGICMLVHFGGPRNFFSHLCQSLREDKKARFFAWISFGFVSACFLSLVCAEIWPLSYDGKFSQVHLALDSGKLWYFAWPFVLWIGLKSCTVSERKKIVFAWLGAFGILSVIGIIQHFTAWPRLREIPTWSPHKYYHATLFMGHHLSVASSLIFPFFALLDLKKIIPTSLRVLGVVLGCLMFWCTYSRTLWIALPIGLFSWTVLYYKKRGRITILLLLAVTALALFQSPRVRERWTLSTGISTREDLWDANIHFFEDRPLTGVGLKHNEELSGYYLMEKFKSNDVFQGHAHNNVLDILGSTGTIGFLFFLLWWGFLFWVLAVEIRNPSLVGDPNFTKGLFAALIVFQINGITQVNFWDAKVQHQLMWIVAWILLWTGEQARE